MRNFFHCIHEWATRKPVSRYVDPMLGELVINESCWQCSIDTTGGHITLSIGGRNDPDEKLLETARETLQQIDNFVDRVSDYLSCESQEDTWRQFADEINSLTIADVNYWWPRKPETGMVFFRGPDECKLWHCDINGQQFSGLAFDS